ncbi:unnamed protein product [Choristocarpus tenellus]
MSMRDVAGTSPRVQDESRPYDRRSELDGLGLPSGYGSEIDNSVHGMLFRLSKEFVEMEGQGREAPFGFNGLGELVYRRTYSRFLREDGDAKEEWYWYLLFRCSSVFIHSTTLDHICSFVKQKV